MRDSEDDQCDGIPVRPEIAVPRHSRTDDAEDNADASADQGVLHGFIRSQPRGYVATDDPEDHAIRSGKQEWFAGSVPANRRKYGELVQERVSGDRENHNEHEPGEDSPDALTKTARWRSSCRC